MEGKFALEEKGVKVIVGTNLIEKSCDKFRNFHLKRTFRPLRGCIYFNPY